MAKSPLSPIARAKLVEIIRDNRAVIERYNPHKELPDDVAVELFGMPLTRSMCGLCGKVLEGEQIKVITEDRRVYWLDEECYNNAKNSDKELPHFYRGDSIN
jgi:hypothetical protein